MYYNELTLENIIQNIYGKKVFVKTTYKDISNICWRVENMVNGTIKKIKVNYFEISLQEKSDEAIIRYLPKEQSDLFLKYDTKLWTILHEIGHAKTIPGLVYDRIDKNMDNYKKVRTTMSEGDRKKAYRNLPIERRADKWAYEWALKHPKECEFICHNLRVTMW